MLNFVIMHYRLQSLVTRTQDNLWYAVLIAFLAIASVGMLGYEFTPNADQRLVATFQRIDIIIACIFLTDFFLGLFFNARHTPQSYFKQNWINLISSIPVTSEITRTLRILRILRAFRVIRAGLNVWFAHRRLRASLTQHHQNPNT